MNINKAWWEKATPYHFNSEFYDVSGFINDDKKITLGDLEISELGDVKNKSLLHLQCHLGLDTLSWQRLGGVCTGVDFCKPAIEYASKINKMAGLSAQFIHCDVYKILSHIEKEFDILYTSYGVLSWLKDLDEYARIVYHSLKTGGIYYLVEIHPFFNIFDIEDESIKRPYFLSQSSIDVVGSYIESEKSFANPQICFSYTLSNIINALIKAGLKIVSFNEFDYSTYKFHNKLIKNGNKYIFKNHSNIPLIFSLKACK